MKTIATKNFELSVYMKGDENSEKLMLCLPGRLDTKDYPHMRGHVDYFSERGYLAVSFDPPGTWESAGGIEMYSMTNYLQAINELIEYFGNKPTVLLGHSRGGSMAMYAGSTNPHVSHIVAVMSRVAASKPDGEARETGIDISYRDTPEHYEEREKIFHVPLSYFEDAKQHDVISTLKDSVVPKLFMYGTEDVLVTPEEVQKTFNTVAEPKELYELHSEHDYRKHPKIIDEVNKVVEKFLEKYSR